MKIHEEHCKESLSCMSVKTMQLLTQMILSYIVLCRWQRLNLQEMLEIDQELCMMEAFGNLGSGKKCRCLPTARFNANIQILDSFDSFTIQRSISRLQVRFISCYCSTAKDPVLKCNLFEKKATSDYDLEGFWAVHASMYIQRAWWICTYMFPEVYRARGSQPITKRITSLPPAAGKIALRFLS